MEKIIAFFMSIWMFILSIFGLGGKNTDTNYVQNLAYGSQSRQVVDIAYPETNKAENGLVLFIHGGAWIAGDKSAYTDSIKYLASIGCTAATMNYRYISEKSDCRNILDDVTSALQAIKNHAAERGIDLKKVMLVGTSAGAHISMLYAYSKQNVAPIAPVAVWNQCGPVLLDADFISTTEIGFDQTLAIASALIGKTVTKENMRSEEIKSELAKVSPLTYAKTAVPTVISHGEKDTIVPFVNAVLLDNALSENEIRHDFVPYPNSNHGLDKDNDCADKSLNFALQYMLDYLV